MISCGQEPHLLSLKQGGLVEVIVFASGSLTKLVPQNDQKLAQRKTQTF